MDYEERKESDGPENEDGSDDWDGDSEGSLEPAPFACTPLDCFSIQQNWTIY